jgi:hypothetical protein
MTVHHAARRANPAKKKTRPTRSRVVYGFEFTVLNHDRPAGPQEIQVIPRDK